ncbi:relaxin-3a [Myxocyprinus asiaticus]|uniref:relaxin-3a n=1 Tax=Myxocyprinus asiaticus TaxID=70543 RepID=UPI002221662F|nr:relaxin-3a [Myxocyprinus asiaticus]
MMWKTTALAVCLLLAGVESLNNPSYGVKLCGREFIRAVIFTCGGSRWKRSLTNTDEILDLFNSDDNNAAESWMLHTGSSSSQHTSDPKALSVVQSEQEGIEFSRPARSLISQEVLEALRTVDRKGRDVVVGLSNACCKWGCSKGEISSLC